MEKPARAPKPLPTLLNKSDAMLFAADNLESHISNLELAAIVQEVFNKPRDDREDTEENKRAISDLLTLTAGIVDKDIQVAAMKAAAVEIRALANETKLAEARAASRGLSITA